MINKLRSIVKTSKVLSDKESLFNASYDNTRFSFLPEVVVKIKEEDDIASVLKFAYANDIAITPRGAGTGCCGGALPIKGGMVLDFGEYDKISIDPLSKVANVQAGAITANVNKRANECGLFYPPDPSSDKYSTIGGNIACNAGGLRACKYFTTRDYLLSATAFLANGERLELSLDLKKCAIGYNLRDLLVGSEGTLAVISRVSLRLLDLPKFRLACLGTFKTQDEAFDSINEILKSHLKPSIFEFMDAQSYYAGQKYMGKSDCNSETCSVLLEFDGNDKRDIDGSFEELKALDCGQNFVFAKDENESQALWQLRKICSQASYLYADTKLNQDIVLPFDRAKDFFIEFKAKCKQGGFYSPTFGHCGDGNYHIHIMYDSKNSSQEQRAKALMSSIIERVVELGGAISGEHAIGLSKLKYMHLQHSKATLSLMKSIKNTLDPKDILNSQKVLGNFDLYQHTPLKSLKTPWDK
ncbi:MAG: FAD-binding oxidoreductase [Opitutales bacterium]